MNPETGLVAIILDHRRIKRFVPGMEFTQNHKRALLRTITHKS